MHAVRTLTLSTLLPLLATTWTLLAAPEKKDCTSSLKEPFHRISVHMEPEHLSCYLINPMTSLYSHCLKQTNLSPSEFLVNKTCYSVNHYLQSIHRHTEFYGK